MCVNRTGCELRTARALKSQKRCSVGSWARSRLRRQNRMEDAVMCRWSPSGEKSRHRARMRLRSLMGWAVGDFRYALPGPRKTPPVRGHCPVAQLPEQASQPGRPPTFWPACPSRISPSWTRRWRRSSRRSTSNIGERAAGGTRLCRRPAREVAMGKSKAEPLRARPRERSLRVLKRYLNLSNAFPALFAPGNGPFIATAALSAGRTERDPMPIAARRRQRDRAFRRFMGHP